MTRSVVLALGLLGIGLGGGCIERGEGMRLPRAWRALLACIDEQALSERLALRLVCVDPAASEAGVRPDGCLVVPADWAARSRRDPSAARRLTARLAHLSLHPPGFGTVDAVARRDCAAWVATLLAAEARAVAVETRIREKLGVPFAVGEADAHLAALAAAYTARCRDAHPL